MKRIKVLKANFDKNKKIFFNFLNREFNLRQINVILKTYPRSHKIEGRQLVFINLLMYVYIALRSLFMIQIYVILVIVSK